MVIPGVHSKAWGCNSPYMRLTLKKIALNHVSGSYHALLPVRTVHFGMLCLSKSSCTVISMTYIGEVLNLMLSSPSSAEHALYFVWSSIYQ